MRGISDGPVDEYAVRMSGGYNVRDPEAARVYPVAEWIEDTRSDGGKVYRRRVVVVEDWAEVTEP